MPAPDQVWTLEHEGRLHRVTASRATRHLVRWEIDGELHAERRTAADKVTLEAGEAADGKVLVYYSALGAPRRATLYADADDLAAVARMGGIDLEPEPGSPAERYDEKLREHPTRVAVLAALGGVVTVLVPILLAAIAVHFAIRLPWPHVPFPDLPSIPWPDPPLPDLPLPDLPKVPDRVRWVLDKAKFVWPVVVAYLIARAETKRRRDRAGDRSPE